MILSIRNFTVALALLVIGSAPTFACSIYAGDPATVKAQIIPRLASELGVAASALRAANLTNPGISFLASLGADCSGLDRAIRTTAYEFSVKQARFQRCTYRGVAIFKGIDVTTAEMFINAEETACVPIFTPMPPIRPIINP